MFAPACFCLDSSLKGADRALVPGMLRRQPKSRTPSFRYGYEKRLLELVEQLVKDMDRKIERQKERADKESLPRLLTIADKAKLDDLLVRQRGVSPQ